MKLPISFACLYFLLILPSLLFAQALRIQGSVSDSLTQEPLPFATIQVFDNQNQQILGAIVDSLANFDLTNVKITNDYRIVVSHLGFKPREIIGTIQPRQRQLNLGSITLSPDLLFLNEIMITGNRTVQHLVDRTVYWVDSLMLSKALTAADILSNFPEITVNPITSGVTIKGKENSLVLINGVNTGQSIDIRSVNPFDIERVEVITSPPSSIDVEYDGVINIVLRREVSRGVSGNIEGLFMPNGRFVDAYGGILFGSDKVRVNLGYVNYLRNFSWESSQMRNNLNTGSSFASFLKSDNPLELNHDITGSIDFYPTPNDFINFSTRNSIFSWNRLIDHNQFLINGSDTTNLEPFIRHHTHDYFMGNYTIFYRRNLKKEGNSFSTNVNFHFMDAISNTNLLRDETLLRYYSEKGNKASVNAKMEHVSQLNSNIILTTGIQTYHQRFNGVLSDAIQGNDFSNNRHNIFADLFIKLSSVDLRLGMKVERNIMQFNYAPYLKTSQDGFFPTILLSRQLNQNNRLSIEYRRTSSYPSAWAISPYTVEIDEMTSLTGNPLLSPSARNAFEISHSYRKGPISISTTAYHHDTRGLMSRVASFSPDNHVTLTYNNSIDRTLSGLRINGSITLFEFLIFEPDFRFIHENFSSATLTRRNTTLSSFLLLLIGLPGGFGVGGFGSYEGKRLTSQGYSDPRYVVGGVFVMKQFIEQNFGLFIGLRDITKSEENSFVFDGITDQTNNFNIRTYGLSLRLTYNFNRGKEHRMTRINTNFDADKKPLM